MDHVQIDLLTVLIAAILNMVIGYFWYSKWLFGSNRSILSKLGVSKMSKFSWIYGSIVSLVIAYFLAYFEAYLGITSVTDGMFVGFCFWLGFVATTQISAVIWEGHSFQSFLINTGCKLLSFLAMSGLIGA
ncbi:MAG: hypothetical protein COT85_01575 [Chlamydiae bacterium CG10_big_fil_rev_8_21_14_0_10_42_34]|nr:MAG: hypothetical protein COT85_01575 [Chlamydiae bacterium CG10_big_fil_rev_8_21_14_0_10_42_34]